VWDEVTLQAWAIHLVEVKRVRKRGLAAQLDLVLREVKLL
jgi:hypothetical protein